MISIIEIDDCDCKACTALRESVELEKKEHKTAEDRERLQKLYTIVLEA